MVLVGRWGCFFVEILFWVFYIGLGLILMGFLGLEVGSLGWARGVCFCCRIGIIKVAEIVLCSGFALLWFLGGWGVGLG